MGLGGELCKEPFETHRSNAPPPPNTFSEGGGVASSRDERQAPRKKPYTLNPKLHPRPFSRYPTLCGDFAPLFFNSTAICLRYMIRLLAALSGAYMNIMYIYDLLYIYIFYIFIYNLKPDRPSSAGPLVNFQDRRRVLAHK